MPHSLSTQDVTTPGGLLLVLAVLVPFVGVLAGMVLGSRGAQRVAFAILAAGFAIAIAIAAALVRSGDAVVYLLGGWTPPLGIALRADGLAVVMLLAVAVVIIGIGVYARADFGTPQGVREARAPFVFWLLLLAVWGSLNLVFVSGDLFTLYVALELLTFAGVPLVSLSGQPETLRSALRYLLYALFGSVLYLLGAVLLYGAYGTLDIMLLAARVHPEPVTWAAAALMTVGLLAKTALFPLHLWLPPAHAGAPAAASAVLSGLVIKGSWFLAVRLWLDVFAGVVTLPSAQTLAALGAAAILVGNVVALRQARLKLLIAYSTVAQIGYLFLMFPLAAGLAAAQLDSAAAVNGGLLQAISHATAKAAMFMAAGLIYTTLGHDRIADLRGVARALPMTLVAFALGGASLIGLPPSGGFLAKWLLVSAAITTAQWWWALVMLVGGLLTSAYVFIVVVRALAPAPEGWTPRAPVPRYQEVAVLALALCSFLLGMAVFCPVDVAQIGRAVVPEIGWP
jgi:formate hydrogenlyase subunit 3/multisubunit Na+/H+ antiporter MnhD subunit